MIWVGCESLLPFGAFTMKKNSSLHSTCSLTDHVEELHFLLSRQIAANFRLLPCIDCCARTLWKQRSLYHLYQHLLQNLFVDYTMEYIRIEGGQQRFEGVECCWVLRGDQRSRHGYSEKIEFTDELTNMRKNSSGRATPTSSKVFQVELVTTWSLMKPASRLIRPNFSESRLADNSSKKRISVFIHFPDYSNVHSFIPQ